MAKKKRAPPSNPARGFATTSLPSKAKQTEQNAPEPPKLAPPTPAEQAPEESTWQPPTAEEELEHELKSIIEKQGPKVRREAQRIVLKAETEKRTLRSSAQYYPLKLDRVFGIDSARFGGNADEAEETLGEKVLRIARKEYTLALEACPVVGDPDEALLTVAWTLHKVLTGLGLRKDSVEDALKAVLGRERKGPVDTESILEQVLEWMMLFCEPEDLPKFFDTNAPTAKKGDYYTLAHRVVLTGHRNTQCFRNINSNY
jgi:ATP-dependent RNA helicase DHX29